MKVKKHTLLLIACLIWTAVGTKILRIGIMAYPAYVSPVNLLLTVITFSLFQYFVFGKLVKKHTKRIVGYSEDLQFFLKFFDRKAFLIMAFMMTGGIYIRSSSLVPESFIAVFYTGLGASLFMAGILFGRNYYSTLRPD